MDPRPGEVKDIIGTVGDILITAHKTIELCAEEVSKV